MKAITVHLYEEQIAAILPAVDELHAAAASGQPGMLLAQVMGPTMRVFVINEQQALAFANILGIGVVRPQAQDRTP